MEEPRCLFGYALALWPEALMQVLRQEEVYTSLIGDWLKAEELLPRETQCHGILSVGMSTHFMLQCGLLCELPGGTELPDFGEQRLYPGYAMPLLIWDPVRHAQCWPDFLAWLATQPHTRGRKESC